MTAPSSHRASNECRFRYFAERHGDNDAIIDPDGTSWTRRQIADKVNMLSRALRDSGCTTGSVMALAAPNGADFIISYLAATQVGMYVVPINWHLAAPEIQYIIEDCGADVLVAHCRFRTAMQSVLQCMVTPPRSLISLGGVVPGFLRFEDFVCERSGDMLSDPVQGRVLSYTSATTGRPKGVSLPLKDADRVLDLSISARIAAGTLPEDHVHLCAAMLYHGAPLEGVIVSLHMGHVVVLMEQLEAEVLLAVIERYRVTMAYVVPSMFARLLTLSETARSRYSTSSLRKVLHAGAACPVDVKRRMIEWWGPILWEAYGATEGAGTAVGSEDWLKFPGTVGKPMPGTHLRIVDHDGNDVPRNTVGTIYLTRYSGDRFEYLNDDQKTRASYLGDHFTVGDLGYMNEDGFLFLKDRTIDVINVNGSKVYPAELENLIQAHPMVADCAVIGVSDSRFGEIIIAVICSRDPAATYGDLRRSLVRWLSASVSIAKIPRYFHVVEEIPRDASGKIQKKKLRERYTNPPAQRSPG